MLDSLDLTNEELEKLKGDAVGDSAHSSLWILRTLTNLQKLVSESKNVILTKDFEDDLCILWDMSVDEDIKLFLREHGFFNIAGCLLVDSTIPRLTEIVLGIVVNVYSSSEAIDSAGDMKFVPIILTYLLSNDTGILIQLLRLLRGAMWRFWYNRDSVWMAELTKCEFFAPSIIYTLASSTNDEVLIEAIKLVSSIFDITLKPVNPLVYKFETAALISAMVECFGEITPLSKEIYISTGKEFVQNWLNILVGLAEVGKIASYKEEAELLGIARIIEKILLQYENIELPIQEIDEKIICHSMNITYTYHYYKKNIPLKIDHILATLVFSLQKAQDMRAGATYLNMGITALQLSDFMSNYWLKVIEVCTEEQLIEMLLPFKSDSCKYLLNLTRNNTDTLVLTHKKIKSIVTVLQNNEP